MKKNIASRIATGVVVLFVPLSASQAAPRSPASETEAAAPASATASATASTPAAVPASELKADVPPFDPKGRRFFFVRYGIQFSHESADFAQTKLGSIAYGDALSRRWVYQVEFGGWADKGVGTVKDLKSSFYLTASVGVEVLLDSVFARILVGPTLISHTDDRLSTNFLIHHEFSLGIRAANGIGIGGFLKHFSNGGIKLPNESRDIFGFCVQFNI
jgi:hypothetical protein